MDIAMKSAYFLLTLALVSVVCQLSGAVIQICRKPKQVSDLERFVDDPEVEEYPEAEIEKQLAARADLQSELKKQNPDKYSEITSKGLCFWCNRCPTRRVLTRVRHKGMRCFVVRPFWQRLHYSPCYWQKCHTVWNRRGYCTPRDHVTRRFLIWCQGSFRFISERVPQRCECQTMCGLVLSRTDLLPVEPPPELVENPKPVWPVVPRPDPVPEFDLPPGLGQDGGLPNLGRL